MTSTLQLSSDTRQTAGIILLTVVFVESGGLFLLRGLRGQVPMTPFQAAFARAGHAHPGVLLTLGLVCLVLADAANLHGVANVIARDCIWLGAILIPAGFFLHSPGQRRSEATWPALHRIPAG